MALSSNSIFTRILLTFRFPTFALKVTGEKYERQHVARNFCGFYIRHSQKKIPKKFNMSLTSELSKEPLLASRLNICHILDIASPLAIFRQLCQIRHFPNLSFSPKSPLSKGPGDFSPFLPNLSFSPKSPLSKEPILASNLNRRHSGVFFAFFPFSPLHEILDVTQILLLIIDWYVLHLLVC